MESLIPELQNLIVQLANKNNITNYQVEINNSVSSDGDGYMGILNGFSLKDKDSEKELNLVVKKASSNENLRNQIPIRYMFLREMSIYEEVFPEIFKFQEEYNIQNPFKSVVEVFGSIKDEFKETLLLENVKEDGYKLFNRRKPLDSHHLSLVLTEYGKFHALSHAMKKLDPERFQKINQFIGDNFMVKFMSNELNKESQQASVSLEAHEEKNKNVIDPIILESIKNKPNLIKAIKEFNDTYLKFIGKNSQEIDEHAVICHMDCWSANLLFKYEDQVTPKIPTKVMIIDWQMASINTPIHDISYFLYINAGKKDLENYRHFLTIYHKALSDTLRDFGLESEDVYSFELLEKQWKEKSKTGFFMTLAMMPQTLSEGKTHDFEEIAKAGKSVFDHSTRKNNTSDLFNQRIGDLVEFMVEHKFI